MLLIPSCDSPVVRVEIGQVRPSLEAGEARLPCWYRNPARRGDGDEFLDKRVLVEPAPQSPVEESASIAPLDWSCDDILCFHPPCTIMEVGKLERDLRVNG